MKRALGWLRARLDALRALPRWQRITALCTGAVVALGLVLRARGYLFGTHAFWLDEGYWASALLHEPLIKLLIRPIGFMAVSRVLVTLLAPSEAVLRFMPWVAGLATALIAVPLGRRLYTAPAARLLFVAIVALHPGAIDVAKEFKPYSVSLLFHLLLLLATLRYLDTRTPRALSAALVVANVGIFFTQDLVFAFPGVFLALGGDMLRSNRSRLPWLAAGAGLLLVALGAQYFFIWRHLGAREAAYWSQRNDVFYDHHHDHSYLRWFLGRYAGIAELPGLRRHVWDAPWLRAGLFDAAARTDEFAWLAVHLAGLARLVHARRFRLLLLLVLPLGVHWAFNAAGLWPFGVFRTNPFLITYASGIAAAAFDGLPARWPAWTALLPAAVLVLLPLVACDRSWNERKRIFAHDSDLPELLSQVAKLEPAPRKGDPVPLFVHWETCPLYDYYHDDHPASRRLRRALDKSVRTQCLPSNAERAARKLNGALSEPGSHAWFLTDMKQNELDALTKRLPKLTFTTRAEAFKHSLIELKRAAK